MAAEGRSKVDKTQKNRRRRKKRRTEDFSSDSSSSSSSEDETEPKPVIEEEKVQEQIDVMDIDITPIDDTTNSSVPENLSASTKLKLSKVNLSTLSKLTNPQQVQQQINQDQSDLNQQYLKLFANEFNDDIEELRKKPDFTDKSLVILAKALQSGSNVFDPDTLKALIE